MLTDKDVTAMFAAFEAAGLPVPPVVRTSPEQAVAVWRGLLADVAPEDVSRAVALYLRSGERFWPTPGQLLGALPERQEAERDTSDEAWGMVLRDIRRHGWMDPPSETWDWDNQRPRYLGDPSVPPSVPHDVAEAMHAGLRAVGGWRALCSAEEDSMVAHRASFRAAYRAVRARERGALADAEARRLLSPGTLRALPPGRVQR